MEIDWQAPFRLAFDLGLFLIGSLLLIIIVGFALLVLYAIVKTFFDAFRRASAKRNGVGIAATDVSPEVREWMAKKQAMMSKKTKDKE